MTIEIFVCLLIFSVYILGGYYWCDATYNTGSFFKFTNPLYKPIVALFWLPMLLIGIIYILCLNPIIKWFGEVKEYYKTNK